jgi:hypothetical protein
LSPKADLRLDWCDHKAAKYAVEHWHYSRSMPAGKNISLGAWEGDQFIGAVIFGRGVCNHLVHQFGLSTLEGCELVRVALRDHSAPASRIVSIALRLLKRQSPGIRLVVSFADPAEGHHGGIYQAGGWVYSGVTGYKQGFSVAGRRVTDRLVSQKVREGKWRRADLTPVPSPQKYRYLMPLDAEMRARIAPLAKPYPKRERSRENAAAFPSAEGGVIPTRSLQTEQGMVAA